MADETFEKGDRRAPSSARAESRAAAGGATSPTGAYFTELPHDSGAIFTVLHHFLGIARVR